jgi:plasmid stabilization system protein ParE
VKIRWTPRAISEFQKAVDYLEIEWGDTVRKAYIARIEFVIELIKKFPTLYPTTSSRPGVRRCVITKHNSLYYRIADDYIEILTFYDNRSNPKKSKL